jgi:hypothetical protein
MCGGEERAPPPQMNKSLFASFSSEKEDFFLTRIA